MSAAIIVTHVIATLRDSCVKGHHVYRSGALVTQSTVKEKQLIPTSSSSTHEEDS